MIAPIRYIKSLESNQNNVHLMTFNDQKDYVIKFYLPSQPKALINEWLGYCLAKYLQLPVPTSQIVALPEQSIHLLPNCYQLPHSKFQFASLYEKDCQNLYQVSQINNILNHTFLARIITFDYWLFNTDRTRKNILLKKQENLNYLLWIIDHAQIFGSTSWNVEELQNLSEGIIKSSTHEMMAKFIQDNEQFKREIDIIQSIPSLLIEEILSLLPEEWMLSKEETKEIIRTLQHRSYNVLPNVMNKFIQYR
jgi:hypothetical protein